ncbi:hypothetical protein KC333_g102 [Hortaea werneckii]|nr:hypothetical protein KC333_g102 [Hortaea werneckii]
MSDGLDYHGTRRRCRSSANTPTDAISPCWGEQIRNYRRISPEIYDRKRGGRVRARPPPLPSKQLQASAVSIISWPTTPLNQVSMTCENTSFHIM